MKKEYEALEIEIKEFDVQDVMAAGPSGFGDNEDGGLDDGFNDRD